MVYWLKTSEYVIYMNGRKVEDYKISISLLKFHPNKYMIWIYQKNGERVYSMEAINSSKFSYIPETQTINISDKENMKTSLKLILNIKK